MKPLASVLVASASKVRPGLSTVVVPCWLKKYNRPVICTEFMARSVGSTFDTILPIAREEHVGAINWGLVAGKTQTNLPWESWQHPYVHDEPPVWFHEVLRPDGTPYRRAEADLIRRLTGKQ